MNLNLPNIEQLEAFFAGRTVPKVVIVKNALTYNDAPGYVAFNLPLLKDDRVPRLIRETRFYGLWDLMEELKMTHC